MNGQLLAGSGRWGSVDDIPCLDHERLDVYRCAIEFLRFALRACAPFRGATRTSGTSSVAPRSPSHDAKRLLARIVAMLTRLCRPST